MNSPAHIKDKSFLIRYLCFPSSLGWILIAASSEGICLLDFRGPAQPSDTETSTRIRKEYPDALAEPEEGFTLLREAKEALLLYIEQGTPLPALPIDIKKGTSFQREVWKALTEIPFGETRSYLEISRNIGRPQSARAVGQACGKNPIAVLIPCHRVLAADGKLGGYAGGQDIKKALLKLERERADTS